MEKVNLVACAPVFTWSLFSRISYCVRIGGVYIQPTDFEIVDEIVQVKCVPQFEDHIVLGWLARLELVFWWYSPNF